MANPTATQLAEMRTYVPATWTPASDFTTGKLFLAFQQFGSVRAAALALSRLKLAHYIEQPSSFTVPGEYSQSTAAAMASLREQIKTLEKAVADEETAAGSEITVLEMTRIGGPRR